MKRLALLIERMEGYGSQPCIEDGAAVHTYTDLLAECDRWKQELDHQDLRPGSVIGLQADYSLAAIAALIASLMRGCIVAMIPRSGDATRYLEDGCANELLSIDRAGRVQWQSLHSRRDHELLAKLRADGESGVILYTSGSTGLPKAALQSTQRFLSKFEKRGRSLRTLGFLLFDHVAGLDTLFYTLEAGGTLILTERRDPATVSALIESHRVEVLPVSPSFLRLLCLSPASQERDLSSLKIITYGSEPMDPATLALMNERFSHVQITQKYGTTETGSPKSVSRGNESLWLRLSGSSARSGLENKVVDGVLWLRGESTILGYLNAPSPLDAEGWYCTGDLVDVDGEWLRFKGRAADMINVGGENVSPAEVEQTILELDYVRDAVVEHEKHALLGQIVIARVSLAEHSDNPREVAKRIRRYCGSRLAPYKVPVKINVSAEDLISNRQKRQRSVPKHH